MIHPQQAAQDLGTTQIVHSKITAPLILVLEEAKPFAFASLTVTDQVQMCRIAKLRKDCHHIAFGQIKRESANVDVGCVSVVGVPGGVGWRCSFEFSFVERLGCSNGVHLGLSWVEGRALDEGLWLLAVGYLSRLACHDETRDCRRIKYDSNNV